MRTNLIALSILLATAGCSGVATTEADGASDAPAPALRVPRPDLLAMSAGSTPPAKGTATQDPYGPPGQAGCSFGVTGAVNAWIGESPTSWAWAWPYSIQCSGEVDGIVHGVSFDIGPFDGPGSYPATARYSRSICASGMQDCTWASFDLPANDAACDLELTSAPASSELGVTIAGTFSCPDLVDANDPSRAVSLYAGSFWAPLTSPPD